MRWTRCGSVARALSPAGAAERYGPLLSITSRSSSRSLLSSASRAARSLGSSRSSTSSRNHSMARSSHSIRLATRCFKDTTLFMLGLRVKVPGSTESCLALRLKRLLHFSHLCSLGPVFEVVLPRSLSNDSSRDLCAARRISPSTNAGHVYVSAPITAIVAWLPERQPRGGGRPQQRERRPHKSEKGRGTKPRPFSNTTLVR